MSIKNTLFDLYCSVRSPEDVAFYSSQLVLFGSEFTRLYAMRFGPNIFPSANAVRVIERRGETRETSVSKE